jgi:hypothetical protein
MAASHNTFAGMAASHSSGSYRGVARMAASHSVAASNGNFI